MASQAKLPIVWLIDENTNELRTYRNALRSALPDDTLEIRGQEPYKALQDYLRLLGDPLTACIITDQKLKVSGVANYTGIELANFIRGVNSKLPVYILTNYAEDRDAFFGSEWTVEDIIAKSELAQPEGPRTIVARIIRRVDTYKDILDSRSERMQALLSKSAQDKLDESELEELESLGLQKSAPLLAEELTQARQLEELIQAHERLMRRYDEYISGADQEEETNGE